jgi:hypothetical protein
MRPAWRMTLACVFSFGVSLISGTRWSRAQGPIGSLGGYGAMAAAPGSSMGSGAMAPFGGRFGATMPSRMGGGVSLSFSARPSAMMSGNRPSFTIGPMGGGMSATSGVMGQGFGRRPFALQPLGPSGEMAPGDGMQPMTGPRGTGVMPPSFGYPFRQPPSLVSPSSAGIGMSM